MNDQWLAYLDQLVAYWYVDARDAVRHYRFCFEWASGYTIVRVVSRIGEGTIVGNNGKQKEASAGKPGEWTKFVNISLAGVTSGDIDAEYGHGDSLADGLVAVLRSGYRVGLTYDQGRDVFIASLTCRDVDSPNFGYTFTSFAERWAEAIAVMLYKHFLITGCVWPVDGVTSAGARLG